MEPAPPGGLRQRAARGVLLMVLLSAIGTLLGRLVQLALPLFLLPSDFGIFALAVLFSNLMNVIGGLGLSTALLPRKVRFEEAATSAFTLQLAVALALMAFSAVVGWVVAGIYSEPRLALPIVVMSVGLFFQAVSMVPRVIANRSLHFGRAAIPDNTGKTSASLFTLGLAVVGLAYWSPVYGTLLGGAIGTALQLAASKWRPRLGLDKALARELVRIGQFVMLAVLANFIAHSIDSALVGLLLGVAPLGFYTVAYSWGVSLTSSLSSVLSPVGYPLMARVADAPARLVRAFSENLRYFGYVSVCLTLGVFVFAPDFVLTFYGPAWSQAILPMQILAPVGALLGYFAIFSDALYALGRSRTVFVATCAEVLLLVLVLPFATISAGLLGTSLAVLLGAAGAAALNGRWASIAVGFTRSSWRPVVQDALAAGTISGVVGGLLSALLPPSLPMFLAEGLVFVGTYVAALQLLTRGTFLKDILRLLRMSTARARPEEIGR